MCVCEREGSGRQFLIYGCASSKYRSAFFSETAEVAIFIESVLRLCNEGSVCVVGRGGGVMRGVCVVCVVCVGGR